MLRGVVKKNFGLKLDDDELQIVADMLKCDDGRVKSTKSEEMKQILDIVLAGACKADVDQLRTADERRSALHSLSEISSQAEARKIEASIKPQEQHAHWGFRRAAFALLILLPASFLLWAWCISIKNTSSFVENTSSFFTFVNGAWEFLSRMQTVCIWLPTVMSAAGWRVWTVSAKDEDKPKSFDSQHERVLKEVLMERIVPAVFEYMSRDNFIEMCDTDSEKEEKEVPFAPHPPPRSARGPSGMSRVRAKSPAGDLRSRSCEKCRKRNAR